LPAVILTTEAHEALQARPWRATADYCLKDLNARSPESDAGNVADRAVINQAADI
jgi:hypothetical protein